ncbi:flavin reductase family protein [Kitasatospora sp. NPDC048239]|uniref:flavin reductase family protein n=1 Tax=Kitasatospora sp. NPDC048239 TaxID=3364046 RepID=UPI0037120E61
MSAPARSPQASAPAAPSPTGLPPTAGAAEAAFRAAARGWSTGVAVVTTRAGDEVFAKTVSSFCTLSLDPLLVTVAVSRHSPLAAAVRGSGRFAVSVLTSRQIAVARRFAAPGAGRALGVFTAVPMRPVTTGAPVLEDALAWFDCRLHGLLPGGDHTILVGRVAAAGSDIETDSGSDAEDPLLYHDGQYRLLAPAPLTSTGVGT